MTDCTYVLVPGLVSDARIWRPLADVLSRSHSVIEADVTRDDSIAAMAGRLLDEAEGDLVAVGHSMGGRVAMEMAHQAPDRMIALVLANTGHNTQQPGELAMRQSRIDLGHKSIEGLAAEWLPPMLDPARVSDVALMADLTQMVIVVGADIHERQIRALLGRPDALAYLSAITCPILLLTGAQDKWSPEKQHREIAELALDAEVQVIDHAGHFLPVERSAETVAAITGWLDRRRQDIGC
ncbi:MAG: alpha/beta hydrolase [Nitratireductor sp.]|nr:alpha/beta hydrolase [Nitratireductor sp.]